jgi:hypothetical protein
MREVQRLGQEIEPKIGCVNHDCDQCKAQPEQEPVPTLEDLEQEIYQNTRNFISRDVMEWMLRRYYTHPPQRTEQEQQIETLKRCLFQMQEAAKDLVEQAKSLTPPQRPWVGLTDEEKGFCAAPTYVETVARIEAKLKEKNT